MYQGDLEEMLPSAALRAGVPRITAIQKAFMPKHGICIAVKELVHRAPGAELPFLFYIATGIGYR